MLIATVIDLHGVKNTEIEASLRKDFIDLLSIVVENNIDRC